MVELVGTAAVEFVAYAAFVVVRTVAAVALCGPDADLVGFGEVAAVWIPIAAAVAAAENVVEGIDLVGAAAGLGIHTVAVAAAYIVAAAFAVPGAEFVHLEILKPTSLTINSYGDHDFLSPPPPYFKLKFGLAPISTSYSISVQK